MAGSAMVMIQKLRFAWHLVVVEVRHRAGRDFVFHDRPDWFVDAFADQMRSAEQEHHDSLPIILKAVEERHARKNERFAAFL